MKACAIAFAAALFFIGLPVARAEEPPADLVRDLCGKTVALLGESPTHGFGRTMEFKVALIRRLVDECHYNAVFFESGIYDFLNIRKRLQSGREVTEPMLAAAIGGLWAAREVQPLIPFLLEKAKAGSLTLGGLDDQLARGTYAQRDMPFDLAQHLEPADQARCLAILQKHTLWQYTQASPYSPSDKTLILGCLDRIDTAIRKSSSAEPRVYDLPMIESLRRLFARDFPEPATTPVQDSDERDHSMYLNFRWLQQRLPAPGKVIVWTATTHAANDRNALGVYIRREFQTRAFALGFSAYSGSYARTGQPVRQLTPAPPDSLEALSLAGRESDTVYVSPTSLQKHGSLPARPLGLNFQTITWSNLLDAIVVFREEHPPDFLRPAVRPN